MKSNMNYFIINKYLNNKSLEVLSREYNIEIDELKALLKKFNAVKKKAKEIASDELIEKIFKDFVVGDNKNVLAAKYNITYYKVKIIIEYMSYLHPDQINYERNSPLTKYTSEIINKYNSGMSVYKIALEYYVQPEKMSVFIDDLKKSNPSLLVERISKNKYDFEAKLNILKEYLVSNDVSMLLEKYGINEKSISYFASTFNEKGANFSRVIVLMKTLLIDRKNKNLVKAINEADSFDDIFKCYINYQNMYNKIIYSLRDRFENFFKYFVFNIDSLKIQIEYYILTGKIREAKELCKDNIVDADLASVYIYLLYTYYLDNPKAVLRIKELYNLYGSNDAVLISYMIYLFLSANTDILDEFYKNHKDNKVVKALKSKIESLNVIVDFEQEEKEAEISNEVIYEEMLKPVKVEIEFLDSDDTTDGLDILEPVNFDSGIFDSINGECSIDDLLTLLNSLPSKFIPIQFYIAKISHLQGYIKDIMKLAFLIKYNFSLDNYIAVLNNEKKKLLLFNKTKEVKLINMLVDYANTIKGTHKVKTGVINDLDFSVFSKLFVEALEVYPNVKKGQEFLKDESRLLNDKK